MKAKNKLETTKKTQEMPELGIKCPKCGAHAFRVVYSISKHKNGFIRRKKCQSCQFRVTTMEKIISKNLH
jgi:transcriptional regulator NrdR family protein